MNQKFQAFQISLPPGLDFQANLEHDLSVDQTRHIGRCMSGLVNSNDARTPAEDVLMIAWPHHEGREEVSYNDGLSALKRTLTAGDQVLTAYKVLVFAALASSRPLNVAAARLDSARTILGVEPFQAMLVSEGVARRTGLVPAHPEALAEGKKLAILSLAFRMLQTDEGRHIKEMATFRVIMTTLGAQDVRPDTLQAGLKQSTTSLCDAIDGDGAMTAILALLRMAAADGQIRLREQEIFRQLVASTTQNEERLQGLLKLVQLETAIILPPFSWTDPS